MVPIKPFFRDRDLHMYNILTAQYLPLTVLGSHGGILQIFQNIQVPDSC